MAENSPAGSFTLFEQTADAIPASEEDEALVLHTSGTTSRPKVVPLLQKNILASARNIAASLQLDEADHCLNIMPLFSYSRADSRACRLYGTRRLCMLLRPDLMRCSFSIWPDLKRSAGIPGVPTMHQALLLRAQRNPEAAKSLGLRFIRSSSASLPPAVFEALNAAFECPVIEAYGMTEAAHQMTSNPIEAGRQKAGFVGIVTNPEVCILDADGTPQPQGNEGEVCIKGENVTPGYENNDAANANSFTNGWFRTGDQGYFDIEGYLKITGRLKEIINRGGEKSRRWKWIMC